MAIRSHYSALLYERIKEMVDKISFDLAHGAARTIESYEHQVGRVQGLEDAMAIAEDIDKQLSGE